MSFCVKALGIFKKVVLLVQSLLGTPVNVGFNWAAAGVDCVHPNWQPLAGCTLCFIFLFPSFLTCSSTPPVQVVRDCV